ncbi:antirestriction protein [Dechloromonas denitrificans]|uniref:antirestriction protein n=1 Tax=Dechloromonas denitrificans TaxID=281362 RepID=UPI001CF81729|nr:antirestriction protein [Dechloromonas denitrificans]UCV10829.1 antirestriction protein [Dechloromonas denitrificans]
MQSKSQRITAKIVPESQRMNVADTHFGIRYPLVVEPMVYQFATQLAPAYKGGYWEFHTLSNGGFLMTPTLDDVFKITADNGYEGTMSAEALGITACLYAYSNLSFGECAFGETCAEHYHWLYEFAMRHSESMAIRGAID